MSKCPPCIFCFNGPEQMASVLPNNEFIHGYENWWLILQLDEKRKKTKQAAGMLIAKRHIEVPSMATPEEAAEVVLCVKDASRRLCNTVGATYANQETVGFNQGPEAGQTVHHAHVHVLPVSESDPPELKIRAGIGGAFEALRAARLSID